MVMYPDAQRKAQEEIDRVIGPGRLPGFEDRPSLPFVEAFYREVQRWYPLLPLGTLSFLMLSNRHNCVLHGREYSGNEFRGCLRRHVYPQE
jgi:hypothetical protein